MRGHSDSSTSHVAAARASAGKLLTRNMLHAKDIAKDTKENIREPKNHMAALRCEPPGQHNERPKSSI